MKKIFLYSSLFAVLLSCHNDAVFINQMVNSRYTISIPEYLKPCTYLQKEASLQCADTTNDVYAVVIYEKKKVLQSYNMSFNLDSYFDNIIHQPFLETIKNAKVTSPLRDTINGNHLLLAEITGTVNKTDVYYKMAIIETPYTFYQILVWTKAERKDEMLGDMMKIIMSFKELPLPLSELPEPKTLSDSVTIKLKY